MGSNYASGISAKEAAAQTAGSGVAGKALTGLQSEEDGAKTAGSTASGKFAGGMSDNWQTVYDHGAWVAGKGKSGMAEQNGSTSGYGFYGVGENAASGFAAGMGNKGYEIENRARELVRIAKKSMENEAMIASPSKVTERIGKFFAEGFAVGIEKYSNVAVDASKDLTRGVIAAFSPTNDALIGRGGNRVTNNTPTFNITVNGASGMNENELADMVINKLQMQIIGSEAVYA